MWKLNDIPKQLKIQGLTFHLRGIVTFNDANKMNLRNPVGHYTAYCSDQMEYGSAMMIQKRS